MPPSKKSISCSKPNLRLEIPFSFCGKLRGASGTEPINIRGKAELLPRSNQSLDYFFQNKGALNANGPARRPRQKEHVPFSQKTFRPRRIDDDAGIRGRGDTEG